MIKTETLREVQVRALNGPPLSTEYFVFFFFTLVMGPKRSLSLTLIGSRVCEAQIRARLVTTARLCENATYDIQGQILDLAFR